MPPRTRPPCLCLCVSTPAGLYNFHRRRFRFLRDHGWEVWGVTGEGPENDLSRAEGVHVHAIPIRRRPHPLHDVISLVHLLVFFARHHFDVVDVGTPKIAVLAAIAARLTGQRHIVFTHHGRMYENLHGPRRWFFESLDRLVCCLADVVVPVNHALGEAMAAEGIVPRKKLRPIAHGSCNGIDPQEFSPTPEILAEAQALRERLGIAPDDVAVGFIGRFTPEKGLPELVEAYERLVDRHPEAHLLLVGEADERVALPRAVQEAVANHPRVHTVAWQRRPAFCYAAMDIVAQPSHREGFSLGPLEAGAMHRPVVATDIRGLRESILPGRTGLLVPLGDVSRLADAVDELLAYPARREAMGQEARKHVLEKYHCEDVWRGVLRVYEGLLDSAEGGSKSMI